MVASKRSMWRKRIWGSNLHIMNNPLDSIQLTANTLLDLCEHSVVPFAQDIVSYLPNKILDKSVRLSTQEFAAFPVARYHTMRALLKLLVGLYGKRLQIVELGAGFTPHYLDLQEDVGLYIEVDLPNNSEIKRDITEKLCRCDNVQFIAGDILSNQTWQQIIALINIENPVVIFSEGVIAQYFTREQKESLIHMCAPLLNIPGSLFVIDDTLRNHKDLHNQPIILEGMKRVVSLSGSRIYDTQPHIFSDEIIFWNNLFRKVHPVDYIKSNPIMDFAIKDFKLIVCMNLPESNFSDILDILSKNNANIRIWM